MTPPVPGNHVGRAKGTTLMWFLLRDRCVPLWCISHDLSTFLSDKGPATSILPSQVNNSPVINHLLLGKKMKMSNRAAKNAVIHMPGHTGGKISPVPYEDLKTKLNSPWRTHIRVHKKNMTRNKSQLGCGDTVGLIEEQKEGCKGTAEAFPSGCAATARREGGSSEDSTGRTIEGQSPEPVFGDADADVSAVQVKLEALELGQGAAAAETEPRVHPPRPRPCPEPSEPPAENKATSKPPQGGHPKTPIFSPFPSVKPLRKSATARNLGLYGPTERTPTVHFPHMSRSFSNSSGGNSGTKKRWCRPETMMSPRNSVSRFTFSWWCEAEWLQKCFHCPVKMSSQVQRWAAVYKHGNWKFYNQSKNRDLFPSTDNWYSGFLWQNKYCGFKVWSFSKFSLWAV